MLRSNVLQIRLLWDGTEEPLLYYSLKVCITRFLFYRFLESYYIFIDIYIETFSVLPYFY